MKLLAFEADIGCTSTSVEELQRDLPRNLSGAIELHNGENTFKSLPFDNRCK